MSSHTLDSDHILDSSPFEPDNTTHSPSEPWGDTIDNKSADSIRLYFQNIRGLSTKHIWSEWNNLLDCLQSHQVDIFGFAETNIPWTPTTKHIAQQQMKIHGRNSKALLSATSCDKPTLGWKQPGGVCIGALGPIVGGIEKHTSDETGLGRWSILQIRCSRETFITILSAYGASQSNQTNGTDTAYNQQYRALRRQGHSHPKPRLQFITDLTNTIQSYKKVGEVIVMLDANADITEKHMTQLLNATDMYDVMGYKHTTHTPPTFIRGTKTIDLVLATKPLLPTIRQAGMLSFNHSIQSDHRGLWIDFNYKDISRMCATETDLAFGNYVPVTKHVTHCTQLKKRFTEMYETSHIKEKIDTLKLQINTQTHKQSQEDLNLIDALVDKAMLQPLKQITPPTSAW